LLTGGTSGRLIISKKSIFYEIYIFAVELQAHSHTATLLPTVLFHTRAAKKPITETRGKNHSVHSLKALFQGPKTMFWQ